MCVPREGRSVPTNGGTMITASAPPCRCPKWYVGIGRSTIEELLQVCPDLDVIVMRSPNLLSEAFGHPPKRVDPTCIAIGTALTVVAFRDPEIMRQLRKILECLMKRVNRLLVELVTEYVLGTFQILSLGNKFKEPQQTKMVLGVWRRTVELFRLQLAPEISL